MNQNKTEENKPSFMIKLASFIVDKRNLFFLIFAIAIIFSLISKNWVSVENSLAAFLPDTSETAIGLSRMEENFVTYGTAKIMVANISYEDAEKLADRVSSLPYVSMVLFDNTTDHYNDFSALLDAFYTRRSQGEEMRRRTAELRRTVKNARDRCTRKLAAQTAELEKTKTRDEKRRWGDLITANLYRAPKQGASSMTATDYYADGCPEVTVPLDPLKSGEKRSSIHCPPYFSPFRPR